MNVTGESLDLGLWLKEGYVWVSTYRRRLREMRYVVKARVAVRSGVQWINWNRGEIMKHCRAQRNRVQNGNRRCCYD